MSDDNEVLCSGINPHNTSRGRIGIPADFASASFTLDDPYPL
jgi:hypothetical protein